MSNPLIPSRNCPHCNSSRMEYYAFTLGWLHYYYKCSNCHKYTEYRYTLKKFLIINFFAFLIMAFITIPSILILGRNPLMAIMIFFPSILIYVIIGYKYRWYGSEKIALEDIPSDLGIFRAPNKKIRLIIVTVSIVSFLGYTVIFIINLLRQL